MRPIGQIIADAQDAVKRQRANEAEIEAAEIAETRRKNAEAWLPIVEGLKPFIPVELHNDIAFDPDSEPEYWHSGEYVSGIRRRPIEIVLPTPEQYTVLGYFFSEDCCGFTSGVVEYDEDGRPYFAPERHGLGEAAVRQLSNFTIALGVTIKNYQPRTPKKIENFTPEPSTITNQFTELLRAFIRQEIEAAIESV